MSCEDNLGDWLQFCGTLATIAAGFLYVIFQRKVDKTARGSAATQLARHSIDFVTERLEALVEPREPVKFALRGARATEMIEVMRALDVSQLPPSMIESIALIRSAVYAINSRIDEVLKDDAKRIEERRERLHSAGRNLAMARSQFEELPTSYRRKDRGQLETATLSKKMSDFISEAEAALKNERIPAPRT